MMWLSVAEEHIDSTMHGSLNEQVPALHATTS